MSCTTAGAIELRFATLYPFFASASASISLRNSTPYLWCFPFTTRDLKVMQGRTY